MLASDALGGDDNGRKYQHPCIAAEAGSRKYVHKNITKQEYAHLSTAHQQQGMREINLGHGGHVLPHVRVLVARIGAIISVSQFNKSGIGDGLRTGVLLLNRPRRLAASTKLPINMGALGELGVISLIKEGRTEPRGLVVFILGKEPSRNFLLAQRVALPLGKHWKTDWRPGTEDGMSLGVLLLSRPCRPGVRAKLRINMGTLGEPGATRLSEEGRTGPGGEPSSQKSPCGAEVGQHLGTPLFSQETVTIPSIVKEDCKCEERRCKCDCLPRTGVVVSPRLLASAHSQVLSHLCSTWRLLAAGFPPWPGPPLLRQPGRPGLPQSAHVDAELSTDTQSTWAAEQQDSQPHTILCSRPPRKPFGDRTRLPRFPRDHDQDSDLLEIGLVSSWSKDHMLIAYQTKPVPSIPPAARNSGVSSDEIFSRGVRMHTKRRVFAMADRLTCNFSSIVDLALSSDIITMNCGSKKKDFGKRGEARDLIRSSEVLRAGEGD
ncbi:hypothetical protein PR048_026290 [Dryococelus australis]|uniref:Uncharacterized protein n=1 Tax=Dryococelus australis TaxID=614101 RepID=A0ABQ9GKZ3_9NEOP|nr:hypothetical protein PR048_026290 [Dryococelus australis]